MGVIFQFPYRTVAEISLTRLLKNLYTLRNLCRQEVIPVIKADAYGHGMVAIARALVSRGGVQMVAVATLEEAMELRKRAPHSIQILVLSGFLPHQADAYYKYHLVPMIHSLTHLKSLKGRDKMPEIHLKLDTGMNRLGIKVEEVDDAIQTLEGMNVKLAGLASHFAESESALSEFTDKQIALFDQLRGRFQHAKLLATDARLHMANSGGILRGKTGSTNAVRPGLALYGISPNPNLPRSEDLFPVLEWKTRVISVKNLSAGESVGYGRTYQANGEERVAVVPIGYADGYPRLLGNQGEVLIDGKRTLVRGRISMDMTAVDVSGYSGLKEGALVTLIGGEGEGRITVWEIANWAKTIPYEVLCGLSTRVSRVYLD